MSSEISDQNYSTTPLERVIKRLFAEAPRLEGRPDQSPALDCFIVLKCGSQIGGALSTTPEGTLRMLAPNQRPVERGRQAELVMVEHFFEWDQVADIAVVRQVTAHAEESPRIIT